MTIGILIVFAGYSIASYGVVLIRGYDISLKQWLDPLDPYVWPKGKIPKVPAGQLFPFILGDSGPATGAGNPAELNRVSQAALNALNG